MKRIRIKFCGITNLSDAKKAVEIGVDALGFVFAESKRKISALKAKTIISSLHPFITTVGVFMDQSIDEVINITNSTGIDVIQLHGNESLEYCQRLYSITGRKIIKAIQLTDDIIFSKLIKKIKKYFNFFILFDSPKNINKPFNWEILSSINIPFIIAGSLNSKNVVDLIKTLNPYCIDVSSGIEKLPGIKDHQKMIEFVNAVNKATKQYS